MKRDKTPHKFADTLATEDTLIKYYVLQRQVVVQQQCRMLPQQRATHPAARVYSVYIETTRGYKTAHILAQCMIGRPSLCLVQC